MRKVVFAMAATVFAVAPVPASAQDADDVAAYLAIVFTPVGALPPQVTPAMAGLTQTRSRFRAQYGRISFSDDVAFNNLGVGLDVGRGRGSMGLTLGYAFDDCEGDCDGVIMLGGHLEGVLGSTGLGDSPGDAALHIGLRGDVGFARSDDNTFLSAVVGVPLSISAPTGNMRLVPFLTPGFGFGLINNGDSRSGVRFMTGGGVGLVTQTGLMLNIGFQRVFIRNGDTQFGIGVAWNVGN